MISDIIQLIVQRKLTPNQFYLLLCCRDRVNPLYINTHVDARIMKLEGYISEDHKVTEKGQDLIDEIESFFVKKRKKAIKVVLGEDAIPRIEEYRLLFPAGKLPSGVPGRVSVTELSEKFTWFFNNFPQHADWDLIIKVTKSYIEEFESKQYQGMRNSRYFIRKEDRTKMVISDLATYCDLYKEGDVEDTLTDEEFRELHGIR